jgi:hypothetical protein
MWVAKQRIESCNVHGVLNGLRDPFLGMHAGLSED